MRKALWIILGILFVALGAPNAHADPLLYDNGPINGTITGYSGASDSFTISSSSTLTVAQIGLWLLPGDTPTSVYWAIGSAMFLSDIASGTSSFFNQTNEGTNSLSLGYDIWQSSLDIGGTVVAGTYWFTLLNATTPSGDYVFWDQNNGPSAAYAASNFSIPSESFQIYGTTTVTPEPGTSGLMLIGVGLLGLVMRKRIHLGHQQAT
jgi:PEP-CTERM motif